MNDMRIGLVFFVLLIPILLSGCIGNEKGTIDNEVPFYYKDKTEFSLNDIFTETHIAWEGRPNSSYILIPILTTKDGEIEYPLNENVTVENTIHGQCINYSFESDDFKIIDDLSRTISSLLYVDNEANLTFYPNEDLSKIKRNYKGSLGLSIWEEGDGKVFTWIFTSDPINWIIFRLTRGTFHFDHSTDLADTSGRFDLNSPQDGWHKIELERKPLWGSPD